MKGKTTLCRDGHKAKMRFAKLICIYHPAQTCSRTIPEGSQPAAVQECEQPSGPDIAYTKPLYLMYRDVAKNEQDRTWLQSHSLRYDITVMPAADLGGEYVKTKGHYHPENPAGVGYPEVYEVLEGKAHFLLQKKTLDDIVLVEAAMGDIVLIPPGYGHVTINPAPEETLTMANLVSTDFSSEYGFYPKFASSVT